MRLGWVAAFALVGCGRIAFDPLGGGDDTTIGDGGGSAQRDAYVQTASHGSFVEVFPPSASTTRRSIPSG